MNAWKIRDVTHGARRKKRDAARLDATESNTLISRHLNIIAARLAQ